MMSLGDEKGNGDGLNVNIVESEKTEFVIKI